MHFVFIKRGMASGAYIKGGEFSDRKEGFTKR